MILDKINTPDDLKKVPVKELDMLADKMRELIIKKVNTTGGHMGPNLGIIEATIALHYVFNSPKDKIVYDVSHQSYVHKMLTGRKDAFLHPAEYDHVSGYSEPQESEHDFFKIGHTSTSVSLASGLAKARDLKNENYNVYKYYSSKDLLKNIDKLEIDLAILDVMMPDIDGFELCNIIRKRYNFPIIFATAKVEDIDKITGLSIGADDYVT